MEKATPPPLPPLLLAVVVQQYNYIAALPHCIQCNFIVALLLLTSKQPTIVGVAFSISEVVYSVLDNTFYVKFNRVSHVIYIEVFYCIYVFFMHNTIKLRCLPQHFSLN
jgi:hypothetical protein